MRTVARVAIAVLATSSIAGGLFAGVPAVAQTVGLPSTITVDGQASADLAPDAAELGIGVEAERTTPTAATADVARAAQAVSDGLKADGIADKDMGTSAIMLDLVYPEDDVGGSGRPRLPRAYRASVHMTLTIRPPEQAGLIVAHAVDKGANELDGLSFTSRETDATVDRLRGDAMRDARRKADLYVGALGLRLGRVLQITPREDAARFPAPMMRASKSILEAPTPAMPVAPSTLHLHSSVSVRFAIDD